MSDLFAGPIAKLERAGDHLIQLAESAKAFRERETYRIDMESNAKDKQTRRVNMTWTYRELEPIPAQWPLIVSDLLHNLRGSLDYAVWALSLRNVGAANVRHPNAVMFPIFAHEDHFDSGTVRSLAYVTDDDRAVIKSLQPFKAEPSEPDPHPLIVLHHLNRLDKHRELNIVMRGNAGFDVEFRRTPPGLILTINDGPILEDGTVLAAAAFLRPNFSVPVDVQRTIAHTEAIDETSETPVLPLGEACQAMLDYTLAAVARMDPENRPVKRF